MVGSTSPPPPNNHPQSTVDSRNVIRASSGNLGSLLDTPLCRSLSLWSTGAVELASASSRSAQGDQAPKAAQQS